MYFHGFVFLVQNVIPHEIEKRKLQYKSLKKSITDFKSCCKESKDSQSQIKLSYNLKILKINFKKHIPSMLLERKTCIYFNEI